MTKLSDLGIREGTNKEKCAIEFLKASDRDATVKRGVKLGLQESTVRTWCSQWAGGGKKKVAKKAPAKAAKKAAPAKTAKAAPKKAAAKKAPAKVKRETLEAGATA